MIQGKDMMSALAAKVKAKPKKTATPADTRKGDKGANEDAAPVLPQSKAKAHAKTKAKPGKGGGKQRERSESTDGTRSMKQTPKHLRKQKQRPRPRLTLKQRRRERQRQRAKRNLQHLLFVCAEHGIPLLQLFGRRFSPKRMKHLIVLHWTVMLIPIAQQMMKCRARLCRPDHLGANE